MSATPPASLPVRERWRTAGRFADVLVAEIKTPRNSFVARFVSWLNLCRLCQDLEEQMLLARTPAAEDVQLHRSLLSQAIAGGEGLLLEGAEQVVPGNRGNLPDAPRAPFRLARSVQGV
jgi:hypothetical protein